MLFFCRQSKPHGLLAAIGYVIIGLRTHFWLRTCLPRITHILLSWTIFVLMSQRKQFIRVNRMPYIAHTLIWLPVSVVVPHRKQFKWINRVPCIAHATKIWTVFDGSAVATFCTFFDGFWHQHLRLMHRTQFRQRVSDRSVALAASWSSDCYSFHQATLFEI